MQLVKIISTEIDNLNSRIVKYLRFGKSDVQTSPQVAPYGVDSNPIKDMVAVYAPTSEKGETVVIGYINKNQLAGVGEHRTFSTDANGELKFFVWLKNDGTLELGGGSNHLATFEKLKEGFDQLKKDFNDHLTAFNAHMHPTAASGPPSPPTPGDGIPAIPSTASIDDSKIDEIKTL